MAVARPASITTGDGHVPVRKPGDLLSHPILMERHPSLRERIYSQAKALISTGALPPGQLISVAQLADKFQVSRTPVREALLELVSDGVLRAERNRGFRVVILSPEQLDQIFEVRVVLETYALSQAAGRRDRQASAFARARQLHTKLEAALDSGDMIQFLEVDREFHLLLVSLAGNELLTDMIRSLRDHLRLPHLATLQQRGELRSSTRDHLDMLRAVEARDARAAAAMTKAHLARARQGSADGAGNDGAATSASGAGPVARAGASRQPRAGRRRRPRR